jgi:hypothetical protein
MKKAELKEYIKSRISEIFNKKVDEATVSATVDYKPKSMPDKVLDIDPADTSTINKLKADPNIGSLTVGTKKIKEALLDEARAYTIADDFREKAQDIKTGGPINPARLAAVLDFIDGKETITGPQIAAGVGFAGKLPRVYPILAALISVGALELPGSTEEPEEKQVDVDDEEYRFRDVADDEPEIDTIEKVTVDMDPTTQVASTFTVDNADLISSIINNYKDSKARVKMNEADDLDSSKFTQAALKSKESSVGRLDKKIDQLASKIAELSPEAQTKVLEILDFKFKSVDASSLTKLIAKKVGQEAPSVDVEFDEEEISEDVEDISNPENATVDKMYDQVYERMNKLVNYKG